MPAAVILAGGLGTRLQAVVPDLPKPMAPVRGRPFLEWQMRLLGTHGVRSFLLCTGYLHHIVSDHFRDGARWGWEIRYSVEEKPLGTGGALRNARGLLDGAGAFLLVNGDTYLDIDYRELTRFHRSAVSRERSVGTIATIEVPDASASGAVSLDPAGRILSFREKAPPSAPGPQRINAGVYLFEEAIFRYVPDAVPSSLEQDVIPAALRDGAPLNGFPAAGRFIDIGSPEGYEQIVRLLGSA